jgi:hypothetical protein
VEGGRWLAWGVLVWGAGHRGRLHEPAAAGPAGKTVRKAFFLRRETQSRRELFTSLLMQLFEMFASLGTVCCSSPSVAGGASGGGWP